MTSEDRALLIEIGRRQLHELVGPHEIATALAEAEAVNLQLARDARVYNTDEPCTVC